MSKTIEAYSSNNNNKNDKENHNPNRWLKWSEPIFPMKSFRIVLVLKILCVVIVIYTYIFIFYSTKVVIFRIFRTKMVWKKE